MERDDSVEMDWNRARLSSMKVCMELNVLVEVPMRWLMTWTFFDDGMPKYLYIKKKDSILKSRMSNLPGIWVGAKPRLKNPTNNKLLIQKKKEEHKGHKSTDKYQLVVFTNTSKAISSSITTNFVKSYS